METPDIRKKLLPREPASDFHVYPWSHIGVQLADTPEDNARRFLQAADAVGIYLDTSQMDGINCIRRQIEQGLLPRLLFGSHTPLFETYSAFARMLHDITDTEAEQIFSGNAAVMLENSGI